MSKKKSVIPKRSSLTKPLATRKKPSDKLRDVMIPTPFEPKESNRWICYIENEKNEQVVPSYLINGFHRPTISSRTKISGTTTKTIGCGPGLTRISAPISEPTRILVTDNIRITSYDPINPSASKIFTNLLNNDIKLTIRLVFLGPIGDKIEEWVYKGCKIKEIEFNFLEWSSKSEPSLINITISTESSKLI